MKKTIAFWASFALAAAFAQEKPGEAPALNWEAAPVDIVLQTYGEQVDRTVLKDPAVPNATITLKSREGQRLSKEEYLEAIEVVLEMNGIHLEPYGAKFVRAVPRGKARKEGIPLYMDVSEVPADQKDGTVVSVMIPFRNIAADEAQKSLEALRSDTGSLLGYERTNSILVTDTWQNIRRMDEVVRAIDVASPVTENVFVRQIRNAAAQDILTHLQKIVEESMKEQEKSGRGVQNAANQPQGLRPARLLGAAARPAQPEAPKPAESGVTSISDADRGMIRGKVMFLADERSNKLVVVTTKSNMDFFDKIIEQLDVETTPDTVVKVYRLKYAEAEEVSDMINDLIGNAASSKSSTKGSQNPTSRTTGNARVNATTGATTRQPTNQRTGDAKAGELSKENTTVLADKRINGLVVMTNKDLVPVLEQIIEAMDVKLSQVLIETVILQVQLSDEISTGIDWVTGLAGRTKNRQGLSGGSGTMNVKNIGSLDVKGLGAADMIAPGAGGLNYYAVSKALDLGAVVQASKGDSRAKLVASPIIMTVDNKEATIEATKMRYLLKGYTYSGSTYNGSAVPDYEQKDIGLKAKVTPKINPNGTVMLKVSEEFSALGDPQVIQAATGGTSNNQQVVSGISVETTVKRTLEADITVDNRQTVILGGLTQTEVTTSETGIPILKDIPWIGRYLFGSTKDTETRQELLMFLTPYVLDDADSAVAEARRRKTTMSDPRPWDDHGWSGSSLSDGVDAKEILRRKQREWEVQDKEYEAEIEVQKANRKRVKELQKRAEKASAERAREAAELAERINREEERRAEARAEAQVRAREDDPLLKSLQSEAEAESGK